jgi:hypothetical protein
VIATIPKTSEIGLKASWWIVPCSVSELVGPKGG